jgi:HAD superfamily hydrolase (TIGR01509 family)
MQGMSSREWSAFMHDDLGVGLEPADIDELVVADLLARYAGGLPLLPGAVDAVHRLAAHWPLALASSANRVVIDTVVATAGLGAAFAVTVSSEEVARGKPAPDVYLAAAARLGVPPEACGAVEDAANGIRSALAAAMTVIALPNPRFPPPPDLLARCTLVVHALDELTEAAIGGLPDIVEGREARLDEQEVESFPASDPHADWAGPGS